MVEEDAESIETWVRLQARREKDPNSFSAAVVTGGSGSSITQMTQ